MEEPPADLPGQRSDDHNAERDDRYRIRGKGENDRAHKERPVLNFEEEGADEHEQERSERPFRSPSECEDRGEVAEGESEIRKERDRRSVRYGGGDVAEVVEGADGEDDGKCPPEGSGELARTL